MSVPPPDPPALDTSRRAFLGCCASLAAAAAGCAHLGDQMRSAYVFANDAELAGYRPVIRGLIRAVLALEHPAFPLNPDQIEHRLLDLFHFEDDARFRQLQQMLLFFDDVALFSYPQALHDAERVARDMEARGLDSTAELAIAARADEQAGQTFVAQVAHRRFVQLPLEQQRQYMQLWSKSAFVVKRQFHASARALIVIAAYSLEEMWRTIGYDGPWGERSREV